MISVAKAKLDNELAITDSVWHPLYRNRVHTYENRIVMYKILV